MRLQTLLFASLLALAGTAFADTPPPSAATGMGPGAKHMGPCEKDPAKCEADAAKFDQWCQANQQKCTDLKAWAEHRREACEKDKPKCEEMREKMEARHAQICKQDPSMPHCHAIRANHQPGDDTDDSGDQAPPPPPSA